MKVHYSSASAEWETPADFFAEVSRRFSFNLDVCATEDNAKCDRFFTVEDDGLAQPWFGCCWMNPPYGREIGKWMRKAYESALAGGTVVCLVPARTDTAWWHDYAMKGDVEFIRGRLKFGDRNKDAPFPCALVVFRAQALARAASADGADPKDLAEAAGITVSYARNIIAGRRWTHLSQEGARRQQCRLGK